jgi:hypothetical protein
MKRRAKHSRPPTPAVPDCELTFGNYRTPQAIAQRYPAIGTVYTIQHDLRQRATNGLAELDCLRLVGQKFFLDEPVYLKWKFSRRPS